MKTLIYFAVLLCLSISSCKKADIKAKTLPFDIYIEIIGEDGKNIIHSVNDSLMVTYTKNGITQTARLTIYKVQVSATDTTAVAKYNGFVISDKDYAMPANDQGYISGPSGADFTPPIRNFNLYLNGANIGTIYFDYWGWGSLSFPPAPSSNFTFNGVPATFDWLPGVYNNGSGIASEIEYHTDLPGNNISVLQMQ